MPEYQLPVSNIEHFNALDEFTQGYIEAMFFTECTSDNLNMACAETDDLAPETFAGIIADCKAFQTENCVMLAIACSGDDYNEKDSGRDYWFTRNGHGVGYWDRGLGAIGENLDNACKYNEVDLYRGDDGLVYLS